MHFLEPKTGVDSKGTGNIKEVTYTSPPCWILFWVLCCSGSFPKMLYVKPPLLCKYILNITFYKGITINYEASTHAWHSALQLHNHLQQNMESLWHFIHHSFICLLRNQLFFLLPLPLFMTRFRLPGLGSKAAIPATHVVTPFFFLQICGADSSACGFLHAHYVAEIPPFNYSMHRV